MPSSQVVSDLPASLARASGQSRLALSALLLLTLAAATGCRDDGRLPRYPVSGRITQADGTPLADLTVMFRSVEHDLRARGRTLEDGSFRLSTYQRHDGAVAGKHQVMILPHFRADGSPAIPLHPRYQQFRTSGVEFDVKPRGPNELSLSVQMR